MDSYQLAWGILYTAFAVIAAAGLVVFVYVSVRAGAIAWYRTRLEHLREVWKHIGRNGELL